MQPQGGEGAALFELIATTEARLGALATRLPQESAPVQQWTGVLFRVGGRSLLAPLSQVTEVLAVPGEITPLAGTPGWVLGIANNRGTLLPIFDLAALGGGAEGVRRPAERVLVVRDGGLPCGLVASEVIGIRRLVASRWRPEVPGDLGVLRPFAQGVFPFAGVPVPVIAFDRLLADPLMSLGTA
jgi:twitching motility protein PilI